MATPTGVEKIRIRAYELYLARGQVTGRDQEDWLQAEREVMAGETPSQPKSKAATEDHHDRVRSGVSSESSTDDFDIDGTEVAGRATRQPSRRGRSA